MHRSLTPPAETELSLPAISEAVPAWVGVASLKYAPLPIWFRAGPALWDVPLKYAIATNLVWKRLSPGACT